MAADSVKVRLSPEGIKDVMDALKKVQSEVKRTTEAGHGAGQAIGALGVLFAGQQLAAFTAHAIDAADSINDLSKKTGVATESLSVMLAMGRQAGVGSEALEGSFIKLAKSLDALQRGEGEATSAFARIGLQAQDLAGLSLDEAMVKVADAMARFKDGAGKAATATQIFGKSGANLLPLLQDLANGGFDQNRQKLEKLGAVLSGDAARAADEFNDSLEDLKTSAQAATLQVAGVMLPGLAKGARALAEALASTPAGLKTFGVSLVLVGTAATATAVAVKGLGAAFASLGPIGLAVVALAALTAGLIALATAQEQARQDELKAIELRGKFLKQSESLETQYRKESEALAKAGANQKEAAKHKVAIKKISDELIALSPALKKTLDDETVSWEKKAAAIKLAREEAAKEQADRKAALERSLKADEAELGRLQAPGARQAAYSPSEASRGGDPFGTFDQHLETTRQNIERTRELLKAFDGEQKASGAGGDDKKDIPTTNKDLLKAQIAASLAAAKQQEALGRQALDDLLAYTDDAYAKGIISLEAYQADRQAILEAGLANEIQSLEVQIAAEQKLASMQDATPAERKASQTRVEGLEHQIELKINEAKSKGAEIDRKGRDERQAGALEALKLEGELEQAKGRTGAAALRAIAAEYDQRILLARDENQREALKLLKAQALIKAKLQGNQQRGENLFGNLRGGLDQVERDREAGVISEAESVQRRIALYQQFLPLLQEVTAEQLRLARATGDEQAILQAEEQSRQVQGLGTNLKGLQDDLADVKQAGKDALEDGLGDFLANLGENVRDLEGAFRALASTIARAIAQAMAAKLATSLMNINWGGGSTPTPKAEGGYITGPGTTTSDSIPALLSDQEYVIRARAVQRYGVGFFDALNGMRLPKGTLPRFANGGAVGMPAGGGAAFAPSVNVMPILVYDMETALERAAQAPRGIKAIIRVVRDNPSALGGS